MSAKHNTKTCRIFKQTDAEVTVDSTTQPTTEENPFRYLFYIDRQTHIVLHARTGAAASTPIVIALYAQDPERLNSGITIETV